MSTQPFIPLNMRFSPRTWLTSVLTPIIALIVAYLVALISLALLPNLTDLANSGEISGAPVPPDLTAGLEELSGNFPGVWEWAFVLLISALGAPLQLLLDLSMDLGFGDSSAESANMEVSLWIVPLMLTVLIAAVIYWAHRREGRKIRNSQTLVWVPALVSGVVTGLLGLLLSLPRFINLSAADIADMVDPTNDLGEFGASLDFSLVLQSSHLGAIAGGFAIGFLAAALGRMSTVPAKRNLYSVSSRPTPGPTLIQAVRVTLGTILAATLVAGIYLAVYAMISADGDVPRSLFFAAVPFLINIGLIGLIGSLGGSGVGMSNLDSPDSMGGRLFDGAPWNVQVPIAILMVIIVVLGGIWWARTRDPRYERNGIMHAIVPVAFLIIGAVATAVNKVSLGFSLTAPGESENGTVYLQISWLALLWYLAMGLIVEAIATVSRPRSVTPGAGWAPPQFQGPGYPGAVPPQQAGVPQGGFAQGVPQPGSVPRQQGGFPQGAPQQSGLQQGAPQYPQGSPQPDTAAAQQAGFQHGAPQHGGPSHGSVPTQQGNVQQESGAAGPSTGQPEAGQPDSVKPQPSQPSPAAPQENSAAPESDTNPSPEQEKE